MASQRNESDFRWEVIVVNNASTDNTSAACVAYWNNLGNTVNITVLDEPRPGKSYALNKGLEASRFSIIVVCDDDNWLAEDYLQTAFKLMNDNATVGILGGHSEAVADIPFPDWFNEVKSYYACGAPAPESTELNGKKFIWGAGMVVRTNLFKKIFDSEYPLLLTCRTKEQLISGGDDEICIRAWLLNAITVFDQRLFFQHYMPATRLTKEYYNRLVGGFYHQSLVINSYKRLYAVIQMNNFQKAMEVVVNIARLFFCVISRSEIRERHAKDYLYYISGVSKVATKEAFSIRAYWLKIKKMV